MRKPDRSKSYCTPLANALVTIAFLLVAGSSLANTVTVTTLADGVPGSLRAAILTAAPGGTIVFDPSVKGTIVLTNELEIGRDLTITGPGAGILTVSGNNNSRVFNIVDWTVNISGLTISGGLAQGTNATNDSEPDGGSGQGGGILNSGYLYLTNCIITGNTALGGAGGYPTEGGVGTGGDGVGGGICSFSGKVYVVGCTVSFNSAAGPSFSALDLGQGNGLGGGIAVVGGSFLLFNSTIASNSATGQFNDYDAGNGMGGGVYLPTPPDGCAIGNCTISGNTSSGGGCLNGSGGDGLGGGIYAGAGSLYLETISTIVSGNSVLAGLGAVQMGVATGPDVNGPFESWGFNLIGKTDGSSGWNDYTPLQLGPDLTGTIATPLDPALGSLQNNGGQTPTMALSPGSAAIDQGSGLGIPTDQRGYSRTFRYYPNAPLPAGGDGTDIGAFEMIRFRPLVNINANLNLSLLTLSWIEDFAGGTMSSGPYSGAMFSHGPLSSMGMWMPLMSPVRYVNNMFMVRDTLPSGPDLVTNPISSSFYQLEGPISITNTSFIPPAMTTPATQITSSGASLNGTTTPYGIGTLYWFAYGSNTTYGQSTATNDIATSDDVTALTQLISGLNSSSTYHFQLIVTDDWGTQYGGDQVFSTSAPAPPPPAVQTLAASSITTNGALLNGGINGYGQTDAAFFQYGLDTNYGSSTESEQFFGTGYLQDYSNPVTGLNPATTYHYRAAGTTLSGWGYGQDMSFTTGTPPPAVVTLGATSITHGTATLNGTVNPNGASSTVYFQWGATTNYGSITTQTGVNAAESFTANLTGLPPNTTYHYRITALNSGGTSYGTDTNFTTLGD